MPKSPYRKLAEKTVRVVMLMSPGEVEAIDAWGVEAEMPSRTEAVRQLVAAGLAAKAKIKK